MLHAVILVFLGVVGDVFFLIVSFCILLSISLVCCGVFLVLNLAASWSLCWYSGIMTAEESNTTILWWVSIQGSRVMFSDFIVC